MISTDQDQHKVPQVYLKKFGYRDRNNQWKVSVLRTGTNYSGQKSIRSFTSQVNIFDMDSEDPRIPRMFEQLNCQLENSYNTIVRELEADGTLSQNSYAYLLQLIANLIVRSDFWRNGILDILNTDARQNFLQIIIGHHCKDAAAFMALPQEPFFRVLADSPAEVVISRVLIYFIDHLMKRLWYYEIVLIRSQEGKPWFTTTNPVVVHNRESRLEIMAQESELYFPISPAFVAYLHYSGSADKKNDLRALPSNRVHVANDEQNDRIQKVIIANPAEYLIFAGETHLRNGELIL